MKNILLLFLFFTVFHASCHAGEKSRLIENLDAGKKQTVVTYGTSLTAGGAWVRQLEQELERTYPGKAKVINSGSGGMWSTWGVDNLDKRVIQKKPDTVLIEFAINDAFLNYKTSVDLAQSNLENIIDRILKSNPDCEIVLMVMNPPIGIHLTRRPKIKEYYQMYRRVAQARKLLLIDHYPKWESILKDNPDLFNKYVPDGIHPSSEGCRAVITPQIMKSLGVAGEKKVLQNRASPQYKANVTCFLGKVDSRSYCSVGNFQPDGFIHSKVSGKCGFPGKVSKYEFRFVKRRGDKDVYLATRLFPFGTDEVKKTSKAIEFSGSRVIVFQDKHQAIVLEPPKK